MSKPLLLVFSSPFIRKISCIFVKFKMFMALTRILLVKNQNGTNRKLLKKFASSLKTFSFEIFLINKVGLYVLKT